MLEPNGDQTKALRALTRAREDLLRTRVALSNQLRAELERFWPGPIGLFKDLDSLVSLAFLERYPSPLDASSLGEKRLAAFLPREHPDGEIFLSLFKDPRSVICAAELLAEIGDCRARYPTRECTRRRRRPGRDRDRVRQTQNSCLPLGMQQAAARRVRHARRQHPPLAPLGTGLLARARGHDHPRAIRTLGRAWSRVVWQCWQQRTPYDPARHRALQQHVLATVPTPSGPRPDTAATQRMLGDAVTHTAARRAEREALDGKPTSANTPGG